MTHFGGQQGTGRYSHSFGWVSERERREADLFFEDLVGGSSIARRRARTPELVESTTSFEDAADDFTTDALINEVKKKARERATFLTESQVRTALDRRASHPELLSEFERSVRAAADQRRSYLASRNSTDLATFWGLVVAFAERLLRIIEEARFRCTTASNAILLNQDVMAGMRVTWTRTGETLTLAQHCGGTPANCPAPHQTLHAASHAAHFEGLSTSNARVVELAGLFGLDLRSVRSARKASTAAKQVDPSAPLAALSVVAIRNRNERQIHIAKQTPRVVEAFIDSQRWRSLPFSITPGTDYTLFKRRWFEASLHRQWGTERCIAWLQGLSAFYRDLTGSRLGIGDVSHVLGEDMTDHGSHELGLDADLYVLDAPPANSTFPVAYWTSGTETAIELRELQPPAANADPQQYAVPSASSAALAGAQATSVRSRYATIIAYCVATQNLVSAAVWHGARAVGADALQIARDAWNDTVRQGLGTAARPGWRPSWGEGPANFAAIVAARAGLLVGAGSGSYGAGRGWPPHQDHIHVRLR